MPHQDSPGLDRDALILHYLSIIFSIAQGFKPHLSPALEYDDLVSVGTISLISILDGLPFYIRRRARGAILNHMGREWSEVRHVELPDTLVMPEPTLFPPDVRRAIEALPFREKHVIEMQLAGSTTREIGRDMGLSHVRVQQIGHRGNKLLRLAA